MKNLIMYKEGVDSWVRWIRKRIENNLNFLALAEGETGIGKSWAMISVAYMIDKDFESRQIAFSLKQVMEIINSDWFMKKKWRIIVFDESQIDISNRAWQSLTNKLMNYLLSTFRHRNVILLFTSPYSDFLDSQSMKLIHTIFEVRSHSRKTNLTLMRPKILDYNSRLRKFYYHSLFVIRDKRNNKLEHWYVGKPPEHLIKPYEEDKNAFTDKLNKEILEDLTKMEEDKQPKPDTKNELDPDSMQFILWEIAEEHGYTTQEDLAEKISKIKGRTVTQGSVARATLAMRKKGWDIRELKEKIPV